MAKSNGQWRNRIVGYGEEAPDQLLANPLNFRIHPKAQQEATEGSLDTLGWIDDVIINRATGRMIDGHLRVTLALRKGATTIPVKYVELTEEEEQQALLSLDPIAAMAATDKAKLDELIRGVQSDDARVQEFIAELAEREGIEYGAPPPDDPGAQIDKAEELRVKWGVESGQMWKLGEHRLICGDCTDRAVVERVMAGEKAGAVVTDPPYGMDLDTNYSGLTSSNSFGKGKNHHSVIGDNKPFDASSVLGCDTKEQFWFGADYYASSLGDTQRTGSWLVWDKRITESADLMYGSCFELIWSKQKHKRDILRHKWAGFFTDGKDRTYLHPTEKPVELLENLIELSGENIIIYDPFSGSGTTLIACERLNRKCRAVEISPAYCAVAIQRWVDMTQGIPELVAQTEDL